MKHSTPEVPTLKIRILFATPQTPRLAVQNGRPGTITGSKCGWAAEIREARLLPGAPATRVTVRTNAFGFTFFARDVRSNWPVWIPHYGVAVVPGDDKRDYRQVADDIRGRKLQNELDRIAVEPEETYENAAAATRDDACETWLGLSRDMRLFRVGVQPRDGYLCCFQARYPRMPRPQDGYPDGVELGLMAGRGAGCSINIRRHLEDGVLPILHAEQRDDALLYHMTAFVTLEKSPLTARTLRGTQFLVADEYSGGRMHLEKEKAFVEAHREEETNGREEETVLMVRMEAVNTGTTPHYAYLTAIHPRPVWLQKNVSVDEMIRAGLLHLDLITYGLEPDGTCGATIGVYSPIGSESSPIIQFYDSVGWHKLAEHGCAKIAYRG